MDYAEVVLNESELPSWQLHCDVLQFEIEVKGMVLDMNRKFRTSRVWTCKQNCPNNEKEFSECGIQVQSNAIVYFGPVSDYYVDIVVFILH